MVKRSHFIEEETEGREGQGRAQGHIGDKDPPLILHMAQACSLHLGEAAGGAPPKSQGLHLTSPPRASLTLVSGFLTLSPFFREILHPCLQMKARLFCSERLLISIKMKRKGGGRH